MATITKFEDLEIWQLAYQQCQNFEMLAGESPLSKDFELRNQMNASSGSVMDNIAEGFERSGNNEFKNFLLIAKGSNGEFRSRLYRCLSRKYMIQKKFDDLYTKNITLGSKIMAFVSYLHSSSLKGQRYKTKDFPQPQTSNIKL